MGQCCSGTLTKEPIDAINPAHRAPAPAEVQLYEVQRPDGTFDSVPDPGLDDQFEYVQLLGYGGTSQTLLYRHRLSCGLVAIKCTRRPVPGLIQNMLLREITVSAFNYLCVFSASVQHPNSGNLAGIGQFKSGSQLAQ